jgi:hypothetical protein
VDVSAAHAASLPETDDRWRPASYPRDELLRATVEGGMAGVVSHPLDNVLRHIDRMCEGDPGFQFGLSGLTAFSPQQVLALVSDASGFVPAAGATDGAFRVEAGRILDVCGAAGDRLAEACRRGERMIFATGHPHAPGKQNGLVLLYSALAAEIERRGAKILRPTGGAHWTEDGLLLSVRYLNGVAMLTDDGRPIHTHSGGPMVRMLEEASPDLVLADHGFAGTAIEQGIESISVADVNDPALLVAKEQGRTDIVIVMDDNVRAEAYWPCFQEIVGHLP